MQAIALWMHGVSSGSEHLMLRDWALFRIKTIREISDLSSWPNERKQIAQTVYKSSNFAGEVCDIIAEFSGSQLMNALNRIGREYDEHLSAIVGEIHVVALGRHRRRRRLIRKLVTAIAKLVEYSIPAHPIRAMVELDIQVRELYPKPGVMMYDLGDEDDIDFFPECFFDPRDNRNVIAAFHNIILLVWSVD